MIVPADSPLITSHELSLLLEARTEGATVSLLTAEPPSPEGLGRIVRDDRGEVERIVEQKDCEDEELEISEVNTSMYAVERAFLEAALLELNNSNAQGEYYLTDIIEKAADENLGVEALCVEDYSAVQGANSRVELTMLENIRRGQMAHELMESGVTLEDPFTVYLEEGVVVGRDSWIGPNTHLKGKTVLGERVVVEGNTWIINSEVGSDVEIRFSSVLESCRVSENCQVGPFARLRPDAQLHPKVRVGNFVEIKKAEICSGAKVNHLTYIGDAFVGEDVNIGAGTITCNYDGVNKHRTVLEKGSFVGSNSCFVAPVSVGEGAYIGAGSVITKDVPGRSLGLGRARQTVIDGWVDKKNKK
jgi:bifunctional UDP-N-acetylglucosamine pyrophosphorylase/glucosamine-1-phosphate N-acetyltransferase